MRILLREDMVRTHDPGSAMDDERVVIRAFDPATGAPLTRIDAPPVGCSNDTLSTTYEHPEGLWWEHWDEARRQLAQHEIIED
jgi:hypothetical protein